jgi:hypothetical protein
LSSCLRAASGLQQLKSLSIISTTGWDNYEFFCSRPADEVALDLGCLSALTSLTSLLLDINQCYQAEQSDTFEGLRSEEREEWREAWGRQRASLLPALRAMPGLTCLELVGMQMDVRDLALLTSLTDLHIGGLLLPPTPTPVAPHAPAAALGQGGGWPLPEGLEVCRIDVLSPTQLGAVRLPAGLVSLFNGHRFGLDFLAADVVEGGELADAAAVAMHGGILRRWRLTQDAVAAFIAALEPMKRLVRPRDRHAFGVNTRGWRKPLYPPPPGAPDGGDGAARHPLDSLGGHAPWITALAQLQLRRLDIHYVLLDAVDLEALARGLPTLEVSAAPWVY